MRVSCDRQVGEGRFEAGCVATLEQREMRADGFRVAAGRCSESDGLIAFATFSARYRFPCD